MNSLFIGEGWMDSSPVGSGIILLKVFDRHILGLRRKRLNSDILERLRVLGLSSVQLQKAVTYWLLPIGDWLRPAASTTLSSSSFNH